MRGAPVVEQFLASRPGVYNAEEQAWIRRHPSYAVDPQFQARIAAEYNAAQAEGFRAWERGAGSAHGSRRGRHGGCGGSRSGADVEWDDAGDGAVIV